MFYIVAIRRLLPAHVKDMIHVPRVQVRHSYNSNTPPLPPQSKAAQEAYVWANSGCTNMGQFFVGTPGFPFPFGEYF